MNTVHHDDDFGHVRPAHAGGSAPAALPAGAEFLVPPTKTLQVGGREVGPGKPTFVIAELGVNHDGNLNKALELVKVAAACGADAIKLQVFRATTLMHPSAAFAGYQRERVAESNPIDMLRRYELSRDDLRTIVRAATDLRLATLATPFSLSDVDTLAGLRLPAVKIASPDLVNLPLLREVAHLGRPMILSTGAATLDEVRTTAGWLDGLHVPYALLHCVSSYPVAAADAQLGWVSELDRAFDVPVGYSDHTTHPMAGALAVAAGATILEKHLTYDQRARGPDHSASADPALFERYVRHVREADAMRGLPGKCVLGCERDVRTVSRQSLVLRRTLRAGEQIAAKDLAVQRPGTGISAARWDDVVGSRAACDIPAGTMLQPDMVVGYVAMAA
ncbi:MAG TPA: N-acetylneuraminate synthase family protein [Humisphaera sp.]